MTKEEALSNLIAAINEKPYIKRLHELESIIDSNEAVTSKLNEMHDIEKKLVNARYYGKTNAVKLYQDELDKIKEEISDIPYLDEYLDLLDEAYMEIKNIASIIEDNINK